MSFRLRGVHKPTWKVSTRVFFVFYLPVVLHTRFCLWSSVCCFTKRIRWGMLNIGSFHTVVVLLVVLAASQMVSRPAIYPVLPVPDLYAQRIGCCRTGYYCYSTGCCQTGYSGCEGNSCCAPSESCCNGGGCCRSGYASNLFSAEVVF